MHRQRQRQRVNGGGLKGGGGERGEYLFDFALCRLESLRKAEHFIGIFHLIVHAGCAWLLLSTNGFADVADTEVMHGEGAPVSATKTLSWLSTR